MIARAPRSTLLFASAVISAALVVACTFAPDLSRFEPCGEDGTCAAGFRCLEEEGICLPECGEQQEADCALPDAGDPDSGEDAGADAGGDAGELEDAGEPEDAGDAATTEDAGDAGPPLALVNTTLPPAYDLAEYEHAFSATGGTEPYVFDVSSGSLPPGLALDGGTLAGVPTELGTSTFTVRVRDSADASDDHAFTLKVDKLLRVGSPPQLPDTDGTAAYSHQLYATGGTPPYGWLLVGGSTSATVSPGGLVTWQSPSGGSTTFQVRLTDSSTPQQVVQSSTHTIDVNTALDLTIVHCRNRDLADGRVGEFYSQQLQHRGPASVTWTIIPSNGLPPGLTLNGAVISGTPTTAGTYGFTLQVKGGALNSTDTQAVELTIF